MRRFMSILAAAVLVLALGTSAYAETMTGGDWYCRFTADEKMDSNFNMSATGMADVLSGLQPGDTAIFYMQLQNLHPQATDWYMENEVLQSLEASQTVAEGGAYTYDLRYVGPDGVEDVLYSSDSVGGEGKTLADREGLHEATSALEDFFYLDTLGNGQSGNITLKVALEGETQGNAYQDTLARLQMNFAVELSRSTPTTGSGSTPSGGGSSSSSSYRPVRTGDESNLLLWSGVMLVCGLGVLAVAIYTLRRNRRRDREDDRDE